MTEQKIKNVVLCADDFGLNASVSQGIIALAVLGRISATSALVYSDRWAQDALQLSELRSRLDVGLHLDWTSTQAMAVGQGVNVPGVLAQAFVSAQARRGLQEDVHRQLDRFEQHWKAMPDHISGFGHLHQVKPWREAMCEVLMRRYGSAQRKPWIRVTQLPPQNRRARWYAFWGGLALSNWAKEAGWPVCAPLLGAYDFRGGIGQYGRHMNSWLQQIATMPTDETAVVACHPALSAQMSDPIGVARSREFAYLVGHDFVQHLREAGLKMVRGSGEPMTQS
jgi:chitin disaccharide deacetylase